MALIVLGACDRDLQSHDAALQAFLSESEKSPGILVYVGPKWVADYQPRPNLVTPEHLVQTPKFPVIDVHCHWTMDQDPQEMIAAMDKAGVKQAINLSGGRGKQLDQILEKFHRVAPDRFVIFCIPDFSRIEEPDFDRMMATFLENAHAKGVAGVKIHKGLGLGTKDSSGQLIAVDDPRLDAIWDKAGQLHMPVLIHTADPVAFFQPVDRFNERWMQLARHPDWSFHGPEYPDRDALLEQRNRVIQRHPNTIFIGAHVGNSAEDLQTIASWLSQYPNLFVDIAGRVAELGRQPYAARKFFLKYADRILFGTDRFPGRTDQPRYSIYYRFLESEDEYFDYYDHPFPPTGEWKIYGLNLPDDVLKKIYYENAERILTR